MSWNALFLLFAVAIKSGFGLDCTQIPSTSIFAGNTVHLPGPSDQLQIIPANWNCQYNISAPGNSTNGLFAHVLIVNGMKGVNDYIRVTDIMGGVTVFNSRTYAKLSFAVIPATGITVQVVTKSVYMQSRFEITVEYSNVQFGPTFPMKTGGEMNYIDMSSLRDGKSLFNSVTFVGTEPIYVSLAILDEPEPCWECLFIIDGTIDNRTRLVPSGDVDNLDYEGFTTISNAVTILASSDKYSRFVFNPKSERDKFSEMRSLAVDESSEDNENAVVNFQGKPGAFQVVNFKTNSILMDRLEYLSQNCTAYVVSGPPNNSSKVLLDLSTSPKMPHLFDVKYFSVVAEDCKLRFDVRGY